MPFHFNLLHSLSFGLLAWIIAILGIVNIIRKPAITLFLSLCAGTVSVMCELMEIMHRASLGDIPYILDTIGSTTFGLGVMLTVTILLNTFAVVISIKRKQEEAADTLRN